MSIYVNRLSKRFGGLKDSPYLCNLKIKTMGKHYLYSQDADTRIVEFEKFDRDAIKTNILVHLLKEPTDVIEHLKEVYKDSFGVGVEIINFYGINPKTNQPSRIITKGNKDYYQPLTLN